MHSNPRTGKDCCGVFLGPQRQGDAGWIASQSAWSFRIPSIVLRKTISCMIQALSPHNEANLTTILPFDLYTRENI